MTIDTKPDGKNSDLPGQATTMWHESVKCPNNPEHKITGSSRRLHCYECGVWWWRDGYKQK